MFIGHFLEKSPIISGSLAERDLQDIYVGILWVFGTLYHLVPVNAGIVRTCIRACTHARIHFFSCARTHKRTYSYIQDHQSKASAQGAGLGCNILPGSFWSLSSFCLFLCLFSQTKIASHHKRTHMCVYVCMYVCMYVYLYVCMYVHLQHSTRFCLEGLMYCANEHLVFQCDLCTNIRTYYYIYTIYIHITYIYTCKPISCASTHSIC